MSSYGSSSATNREPGAPPVPPPKPSSAIPASSSTTTTARRTAGTRVASRPMPRSTGRYTSARATTTTAATTGASKAKPMPTKTTTTNSSSSSSRKSGDTASASGASSIRGTTPRTMSRPVVARKAPAASRPVGSYYNSAPAPSVSGAASTAGDVASNPYAAPVPSQAAPSAATAGAAIDTSDADTDTWDDWGSPDPKATTTAASTNDWYGSATTTATSAAPGYTSSGFANQQQQQQQPGTGFYQTPNMQQQQQQQQQQPFLSGAMDSSAPMMMSSGNSNSNGSLNSAGNSAAANPMGSFSMFMPSATTVQQQGQSQDSSYPLLDDEPPLLEELGINIEHILLKSKAVVFPFSRFGGDQIDPRVICEDSDLPGPVAILLLLGAEMVLTGKLQFGFIYIYGLLGCIAMTLVVNLVSPNDAVSFWTVTSIMGYALLPVNALALVKIFVMNLIHLQTLGNILGFFTIVWSTLASTRLLELGCGLRDQRYLIMYPLFLFYSAFVMMTIL
eukprot:CAMPEP_0201121638 /NCGR_PEP_ID=MMETSP0850-20130426/5475_1 /ASSEMBLY_ACC=CAM_ASM_000622 /TAXON_ID=183588 /ORGANISM="Pseudo-nitzschia fraudulenta, Strain WWA7" /LENGTH=504 /DNA_ID=CAMNT_0047388159 /DNA_START=106 /DNA_END=1620 /DNA_ORIENTATION=+